MSDWTIASLGAALRAKRLSVVEATELCLRRIERLDPRLRAFITLDADGARRTAKVLDAELAAGHVRGPLHGIPVAHKDLCFIRGLPTSCGTRTPEYFTAGRECTAAARLAAAGAVMLGKLNMSELAMGPFGDNAHHGHVQNPWRDGHASGGSSSGSGAAVAAGFVLGALGSDTGGSIRMPAACCGVVGVKPTYGRVSRAGVMPLSWSNDHVGPLARTVADAALLLGVMAGRDAEDVTTSRRAVPDYGAALGGDIGGLRVGVPENYYLDVDAEVATAVDAAARQLERSGARVVRLRVPDPQPMTDVTNVISRAEAAAVHARVARERPHELQPVVRARLEIGFHLSAYDYLQASRLRARLSRQFIADVFAEVDVLVAPTVPEAAPAYKEVTAGTAAEVVARMSRFSRLTRPFNGLGLPVVSVPCGFASSGLPLGMQIAGRPFDEPTVFCVADAYERAAGWVTRRPPLD